VNFTSGGREKTVVEVRGNSRQFLFHHRRASSPMTLRSVDLRRQSGFGQCLLDRRSALRFPEMAAPGFRDA